MKNFEEFRNEFIATCKEKSACEPEFKRLLKSEDCASVLSVIKDNIFWCFKTEVLNTDKILEVYSEEELNSVNIYSTGIHSLSCKGNEVLRIVTLGSSQATVKTLGSSQATVETWDSSQATVETLGSSQATVKTWGSSQANCIPNGGLIQNRSTKKLFIKKSDYEIVLID